MASCHSKLSVCVRRALHLKAKAKVCVQWHWQIGLDLDGRTTGTPNRSFGGRRRHPFFKISFAPDGLTDGNRDVSDERGQFARCRLHRRSDTKMGTVTMIKKWLELLTDGKLTDYIIFFTTLTWIFERCAMSMGKNSETSWGRCAQSW